MQTAQPAKFFVYGTLRRGEVRERCWPRLPLDVAPAYVFATLYDLGPYPAIVDGANRVRGELWTLAPEDLEATLLALDRVEGYNQGGPDWYVRRLIVCYTRDGRRHDAYAYFWANPATIAHLPQVPPDDEGYCDGKRQTKLHLESQP